jgi:hypothetical protein
MKAREGWLLVLVGALAGALLATATTSRAQSRVRYRVERIAPDAGDEHEALRQVLFRANGAEVVSVYRLKEGGTAVVLRDE